MQQYTTTSPTNQDLAAWLDLYQSLGLAPIPLEPDSKVCSFKGWPSRDPEGMWQEADPASNLGLRCGDNGLLVLDADDQRTGKALMRWERGLGLSPVGALTRRGPHLYNLTDIPLHFHVSTFKDRSLKGEARGYNSYGVAPPSIVEGWAYQPFGDLGSIPRLAWKDIWPLLVTVSRVLSESTERSPLPFHLPHRPLPEWCLDLSSQLQQAKRGQPVGKYATRSEGVFAIMLNALSCGWAWEEVYPKLKGIYSERELARDWSKANARWLSEGRRPMLIELYQQAPALMPKPCTAAKDLQVLQTILISSIQGGADDDWQAHERKIMQLTGLAKTTVGDALHRLMRYGFIEKRVNRKGWEGFCIREDSLFTTPRVTVAFLGTGEGRTT